MIRLDFIENGYPICNRAPAICVDSSHKVLVAYNKFDLVKILQQNAIIACHGIWPGKKMTDCFILNPESYVQMDLPPEDHKEIDNAVEITLHLRGGFDKISYLLKDTDVRTESRNQLLYEYLKKAGIRYATVFE